MSTEIILRELELFRRKLAYCFGELAAFVRRLIEDPSAVETSDFVLMGAIALIAALFLLGGLIRFFTEPWKRKLRSLLGLLLTLLVLAALAFAALRNYPLPGA